MTRRVDLIFQMLPTTGQENEHDEKDEKFVANSSQVTRIIHLHDAEITDESVSFIENTPEREVTKPQTLIKTPVTETPKMDEDQAYNNNSKHKYSAYQTEEVTVTPPAVTNINEPSTSFQSKQACKESSSSSSTTSRSSSSSSTSSSSTSSRSSSKIQHKNDSDSVSRIRSNPNYRVSPMNTDESDVDLSDYDPTYLNNPRENISSSSSSLSLRRSPSPSPSYSRSDMNTGNNNSTEDTNTVRSRKRLRNPSNWKQNKVKYLRNSGKPYVSLSKTKKLIPARQVKEACNCRLKCFDKIQDSDRIDLFNNYWQINDIELKRAYIRSCMFEVKPKYSYSNAQRPRNPNNAFYFTVNNNKIRVCKTFFINTLDIRDRQLRTVTKKTNSQGFVGTDMRGKHTNRKLIEPALIQDIKDHINSIPRIESHYLRAQTSREYISEGKTIADLWRDFNSDQKEKDKPGCEYWLYLNTFNNDFNIGFYQPKKDRCETCVAYELAPADVKLGLKTNFDKHLIEKDKCREETKRDRENIDETHICAVYDLQSVMLCPSSSYFYYCSKINCLNFTITELNKKSTQDNNTAAYGDVYCYFWDETQAQRGVNEIGSCVFDYLQQKSLQYPDKQLHITFYSDNCTGQHKNKSMAALYSFAVTNLQNIESITHKYFIKGHTHNEADSVHSAIEKEINKNEKAGPIYIPCQYATLIKSARKTGKPFIVKELDYTFFHDIKALQDQWGYNFNEDTDKVTVLWNDIKMLHFEKGSAFQFYFKTSYLETEYRKIDMRNKRKKLKNCDDITLGKLYTQPFNLKEHKKKDLKDLVRKNLIPVYYTNYYNNLL